MNYKLIEKDGKVGYLTKTGKSYVLCYTPVETAMWMLHNGNVENNPLPDKPEYPIRVEINGDEYYFAGTWNEPSIFEDAPKPRKRRMKDIVLE